MRTFICIVVLGPFAAMAQPGDDPFQGPCGGPASYGVPLQDVRRFDLDVVSSSIGTDDVPSSSGNCTRGIVNREHASFLHERDANGAWVVFHPESGTTLDPDTLKQGLAKGRFWWGNAHLPVCYKGYGAQFDGKGWHLVDEREWKRSIVRVITPEATYLVAVLVDLRLPDAIIDARGQHVVIEGEDLSIP